MSMAGLNVVGQVIGDIDLGGFDAESDPRLEEDFITTPYAKRAVAGPPYIFLGRKGSGKSALFSQLPRLAVEQGKGTHVVDVTVNDYAWNALKNYREQGLSSDLSHSNAWKLTLAIEVAAALLSLETKQWSAATYTKVAAIHNFMRDNFGEFKAKELNSATSILKGLDSFNLGAFGFSAGATWKDRGRQPLTPHVLEVFLDHLRAPLGEQKVIVELDRLDDAWDGTEDAKSLLVGLLKAAKELNDSFRRAKSGGLRIVIFLRTDIYDVLRFDDKDKHRPYEEQIFWEADDLRDLVSRRLPKDVTVDELFEDGKMRGSILPFDHILKRTFLRPREVLQFMDQCLRRADPDGTEILKEHVRGSESMFSNWKVEDLKQEFSKAIPEFEPLLEALRQQVHRYDRFSELEAILQERAPGVVGDIGVRRALEILFDTSVIGIRIAGAGSTRYKSTDPSLTLPASGVLYVHQSLYKGLNITETRKSLQGDADPADEDGQFE
ncbi:P-loop ATPase, Sll1717 family [Micromonospora citrea]|uniref:P-loop ATPase, Sll1717 family n=1 Tax=Micromonospora citrea TaxID=47855 RepID=UPI003C3413F3